MSFPYRGVPLGAPPSADGTNKGFLFYNPSTRQLTLSDGVSQVPVGGSPLASPAFFVDATNGSDSTSNGRTPGTAFLTIHAAHAACVGGEVIQLLNSSNFYTWTQTEVWKNGVSLIGEGTNLASAQIRPSVANGDIVDLTTNNVSDARFMFLRWSPTVQRVGGSLFNMQASGLDNIFYDQYISSPFQGFTIGGNTANSIIDTVTFVHLDTTWANNWAINLTGSITNVNIANVFHDTGTTTTTWNDGFLYVPVGGHPSSCAIYALITSTTGAVGVNIQGNAQYLYFNACEFESGPTANAAVINGPSANQLRFTDCHFLGLDGVVFQQGDRCRFNGGEILVCQQHGFDLQGGTRVRVEGMDIHDVSQSVSNTYDNIHVAAGVSRFNLARNVFGNNSQGNGNLSKYNIEVAAGASDHYHINNHTWEGFGTAGISDGGTGANKDIAGNIA